jgi:hypothetical protein
MHRKRLLFFNELWGEPGGWAFANLLKNNAFHQPPFVITGLDPVIQSGAGGGFVLDCRVTPGNDRGAITMVGFHICS